MAAAAEFFSKLTGSESRADVAPKDESVGMADELECESILWILYPPSMRRRSREFLRVVYVRTTLGATPSGTGVPDLRCAYPRQGISRRSCMLRRILLKVERGVRRRVCRLRSCLHIPGADQSSASSIPLSNAFLYFMIQAINLIIHVLRSWLSHLEPIRAARQAFRCPMRF